MARKKNVWSGVTAILREAFPYPYPETNWKGEPIKEEEREDYYEAQNDPLIKFLTGNKEEVNWPGVEFIEFEGSFWENVDYDSIPQGTEDQVHSIIKIGETHYKINLTYYSYGGYSLSEEAYEVVPKTMEVVIYE